MTKVSKHPNQPWSSQVSETLEGVCALSAQCVLLSLFQLHQRNSPGTEAWFQTHNSQKPRHLSGKKLRGHSDPGHSSHTPLQRATTANQKGAALACTTHKGGEKEMREQEAELLDTYLAEGLRFSWRRYCLARWVDLMCWKRTQMWVRFESGDPPHSPATLSLTAPSPNFTHGGLETLPRACLKDN